VSGFSPTVLITWSVRCTYKNVSTSWRLMKLSAWYTVVLLACVSAPASAQVAPNSAQPIGTSDTGSPKPPTYTPEQLFGTLGAPASSVNSIQTPTPAQAPQPPQSPAPVTQRPSTT